MQELSYLTLTLTTHKRERSVNTIIGDGLQDAENFTICH